MSVTPLYLVGVMDRTEFSRSISIIRCLICCFLIVFVCFIIRQSSASHFCNCHACCKKVTDWPKPQDVLNWAFLQSGPVMLPTKDISCVTHNWIRWNLCDRVQGKSIRNSWLKNAPNRTKSSLRSTHTMEFKLSVIDT